MVCFNELQKGITIIIDNQPYEILETSRLFKGRGHSVLQTKLKNLISGNVVLRTFHPSDTFEEAEIEKMKAKFIYSHKEKFIFAKPKNLSSRFEIDEKQINEQAKFLKPSQTVEILKYKEKIINISLPIKIQLKVIEAPPGIQGARSQPGVKTITLETHTEINAPLFIKEDDIIEINTETGEYVRRIEKKGVSLL